MGRKLTGRKLAAAVGAVPVTLCITAWNLNPTNDVQDVTSSCSGGAKEYEEGLDGGDGSLTLVWDVTKNPFDTTGGGLKAGIKLEATLSLEAGDPAGDFTVPIIITGTPIGVGVAGRVEVTINFNINGLVTYPTGVFAAGAPLSARGTVEKPVGYVSKIGEKEMEAPSAWQNAYEEIHTDMAV